MISHTKRIWYQGVPRFQMPAAAAAADGLQVKAWDWELELKGLRVPGPEAPQRPDSKLEGLTEAPPPFVIGVIDDTPVAALYCFQASTAANTACHHAVAVMTADTVRIHWHVHIPRNNRFQEINHVFKINTHKYIHDTYILRTPYIHKFCVCNLFVLACMFVFVCILLVYTNKVHTNTCKIHTNTYKYMQYKQYKGLKTCGPQGPQI
jgi:hypothetical protein